MSLNTERRRAERGVSVKDLDRFSDLKWEEQLTEQSFRSHARHERPVNLTARIEDYLKSYF